MKPLALAIILLFLIPVAYSYFIAIVDPNYGYRLVPVWEDQAFTAWNLTSAGRPNTFLAISNGILTITASGNLPSSFTASAQRYVNLSFDPARFRYFKIDIKTSSIGVAARVMIWTNATTHFTILLKTYNDSSWHTEIVDMTYFGINSPSIYSIQLGWQLLDPLTAAHASFRNPSINTAE